MATIPTIFIPGITGNTIVNSNTIEFQGMYSAMGRYFRKVEPLCLKIDERFETDDAVIGERSHIENLAYSEVDAFINPSNGFSLYIFNYDWRKSNATNGLRLKEYIQYLKEKLNVNQFNFVTHSMGSFIFRAYLKLIAPAEYKTINRAVLTVPPNKGSIEPLKLLVIGKSFLINAADSFRKVARTFPSLYELLPAFPRAFDNSNTPDFNLFDPNHWQSNLYRDENPEQKSMLNERLTKAGLFIKSGMVELSSLPIDLRSRIAIIAGNKEATLERVKIESQNTIGKPVSNFFNFDQPTPKNGDGTVPRESVLFYKDSITTITVDNSIWHGNILDGVAGQHALFLTDGRVQTLIIRFLKGDGPNWWKMIGGSVNKV